MEERHGTPQPRHTLSQNGYTTARDAGIWARISVLTMYCNAPCVNDARRATEFAATLVPGPPARGNLEEAGWRPKPRAQVTHH